MLWVGSQDGHYAVHWDEFTKMANREYDRDSKGQLVAKDLVIVGKNWWLERKGYEESEWWSYVQLPEKKEGKEFNCIFTSDTDQSGWLRVKEIMEYQQKLSEK